MLVSGKLGLICLRDTQKKRPIDLVFCDKKSLDIIAFCEEKAIPNYAGNPRNEEAISFFKSFEIDLLLSVNYLFIVDKEIFTHPKNYAINFHGSLLPKYRGRTPHVWAIIHGERQSGVTAHIMEEGCDTGDIVLQKVVEIENDDTGGIILEKFNQLYPAMIEEIISGVETDEIELKKQNHADASIYGKRTPDDGEIDWAWKSERIRNWTRAQAKPYPGAFSFQADDKIIIHKVETTDSENDPNIKPGTIVNTTPPLIKTMDGAVKLIDYEPTNFNFVKNEILGCEK